jgi:hypothetical protein
VRGVVLGQVRVGFGVAQVVDRDDLDLVVAPDSYNARRMLRPMRP